MVLRKTTVELDGLGIVAEGYVENRYWNGWSTPWFTKETADKIMEAFNKCPNEYVVSKLAYESTLDSYIEIKIYLGEGEGDEDEVETSAYTGEHGHITDDGLDQVLYPIGNSEWCWNEVKKNTQSVGMY